MRRPLTVLLVLFALFLLVRTVAHFGGGEAPFQKGEAAPDLHFTDGEGKPVALTSFRGRVVVLNFWATWCAPCLEELPSLDRLHRALGRDGLIVLAVSVDARDVDVAAFLKARGLSLPVLRDPMGVEAARGLSVHGYPTTFVVDAAGRLQARYLGVAEWDLPEALDHFRGLLKASTSPTR
ncbi:MAG TPA: TlpA disulfide reductase family protein [Vicinamibacteria bacterium]